MVVLAFDCDGKTNEKSKVKDLAQKTVQSIDYRIILVKLI
jgi:hypothetical protein